MSTPQPTDLFAVREIAATAGFRRSLPEGMEMRVHTSELTAELYRPAQVSDDELKTFNGIFDLWYRVWVETRKEVDSNLPSYSDNFSRQDEVLVLFDRGTPIAMVCHRYVDSRQPAALRDSFFSREIWPTEILEGVPSLGQKIILASHAFVEPGYRKLASGYSYRDLLCALSMYHINASAPDVFIAMMRKDKGMHGMIYRCGATSLFENTNFYHIPVDLAVAYPARQPFKIEQLELVASLAGESRRIGRSFYEPNSMTSNRKDIYAVELSAALKPTG